MSHASVPLMYPIFNNSNQNGFFMDGNEASFNRDNEDSKFINRYQNTSSENITQDITNATDLSSTSTVPTQELFGAASTNIIIIYLFLVALIGVASNVVLVWVFAANKHLRSPMNWLFISLTMGDIVVAVGGSWVAFTHTAAGLIMDDITCQLYGFITFTGGTGNIIAVTVLAIERFLCVVRPCNISNITHGRAFTSIAITWIYASVISSGPLFGLGHYRHEAGGTWCSIDWEDSTPSTNIYIIIIFIACFFLPLAIVIFCYSVIYRKVKEVAVTQTTRSTAAKAQQGVMKQSIAIVVCLMVAWTPYAIVCLIVTVLKHNPFSIHVAAVPSLFAKTSNCWNPIIYFGLNKQFRNALFKMIPYYSVKSSPQHTRKYPNIDSSCNATIGQNVHTQTIQVTPYIRQQTMARLDNAGNVQVTSLLQPNLPLQRQCGAAIDI
uniref:Ciliary opsin n=1 Tax=Malacoceros fuliginosus TaxID=271776 RepID=A0A7G9UKX0_MALFL|nr:ciliary opsin [Malacoceros fuliginosus]